MAQRFYPAVLERGAKGPCAVWFPDFPGCVAAARDQEEAMAKAQDALVAAVVALYERSRPMPEPTPFEKVKIPKDCNVITMFALGVEPPDPSERVNIYLPKSLLSQIDRRAAELGMSRSSYFGFAANLALGSFIPGSPRSILVTKEALQKVRQGIAIKRRKRGKRPKA